MVHVPLTPAFSVACLQRCLPSALPAVTLPGTSSSFVSAGRRGKDDKGLVFLMVDDALDEPTAR
jgi:hypothetical protein